MGMGDKKHPGRFTVQFNLGDPQQARASEILERQGRQKARFISTAVLHYIHCKETSEVAIPLVPDAGEIEKIVLEILEKRIGEKHKSSIQQEHPFEETTCLPQGLPPKELEDSADELKALLGDGGFSAIANTLESFAGYNKQ